MNERHLVETRVPSCMAWHGSFEGRQVVPMEGTLKNDMGSKEGRGEREREREGAKKMDGETV